MFESRLFSNLNIIAYRLVVLKISSKFELRRFCRTTGSVAMVCVFAYLVMWRCFVLFVWSILFSCHSWNSANQIQMILDMWILFQFRKLVVSGYVQAWMSCHFLVPCFLFILVYVKIIYNGKYTGLFQVWRALSWLAWFFLFFSCLSMTGMTGNFLLYWYAGDYCKKWRGWKFCGHCCSTRKYW